MTSRTNKKPDRAIETKIENAIRQLEEQGKSATVDAIREITKGSYRDLCEPIRMVKARLAAERDAAATIPEMSQEIRDLQEAHYQEIWRLADAANADARRGHTAERQRLEEEVIQRDQTIIGLEMQKEAVEQERDAERARAEAAEAEVARLTARVESLVIELDKAGSRLEERGRLEELLGVFAAAARGAEPDRPGPAEKAATDEMPLLTVIESAASPHPRAGGRG